MSTHTHCAWLQDDQCHGAVGCRQGSLYRSKQHIVGPDLVLGELAAGAAGEAAALTELFPSQDAVLRS